MKEKKKKEERKKRRRRNRRKKTTYFIILPWYATVPTPQHRTTGFVLKNNNKK
jgi:hypothetical protein